MLKKTMRLCVLVGCLICVFVSVQAQAELVGYWSFDEVEGRSVVDSSGRGNDGTLSGSMTYHDVVDGISGKALLLRGAHVKVPSDPSLENQEFTLSFLVKTDDYTTKLNGGISKGSTFGSGKGAKGAGFAWQICFLNGGASFDVIDGTAEQIAQGLTDDNSRWHMSSARGKIGDNEWHLWTGVISSKFIRLYKDGTLVDEKERGIQNKDNPFKLDPVLINYNSSNKDFYIGGSTYKLGGLIDEVRIYNTALSHDEVAALYSNAKPVL